LGGFKEASGTKHFKKTYQLLDGKWGGGDRDVRRLELLGEGWQRRQRNGQTPQMTLRQVSQDLLMEEMLRMGEKEEGSMLAGSLGSRCWGVGSVRAIGRGVPIRERERKQDPAVTPHTEIQVKPWATHW
jgi:hypothetical protein